MFGKYTYIFFNAFRRTNCCSYLEFSLREFKDPLSYIINTMTAGELTAQGVRTSTDMEWAYVWQKVPGSGIEGFIVNYNLHVQDTDHSRMGLTVLMLSLYILELWLMLTDNIFLYYNIGDDRFSNKMIQGFSLTLLFDYNTWITSYILSASWNNGCIVSLSLIYRRVNLKMYFVQICSNLADVEMLSSISFRLYIKLIDIFCYRLFDSSVMLEQDWSHFG